MEGLTSVPVKRINGQHSIQIGIFYEIVILRNPVWSYRCPIRMRKTALCEQGTRRLRPCCAGWRRNRGNRGSNGSPFAG